MSTTHIGRALRLQPGQNGLAPGLSFPIGATVHPDGVNFSIYSRTATGIDLLLFDDVDAARPVTRDFARSTPQSNIPLLARVRAGLRPGQVYAYRAQGAYDPSRGLWFDSSKLLLDPYGRGVAMPTRLSP